MSKNIPTCPFCWGSLGYPREVRLSETETVLGGRCLLCGAHFIVDPTGKNVGEVMMQGLQSAAQELGKDMGTMVSGEDYEDAILSYDVKLHKSLGPVQNFMDGYGRLYIIKILKKQA